ncbi:MAG: ACT domain-containing protein [Bacteroidota bacterium]
MTGETNLSKLIAGMDPIVNEGEYVFVSVSNYDGIHSGDVICGFREKEGTTLIIKRDKAIALGLSFAFVASWITLRIHSAFDAVGLTAAFSGELAKFGISCNVVAGYYHDHIFVAQKDTKKAIKTLKRLAKRHAN